MNFNEQKEQIQQESFKEIFLKINQVELKTENNEFYSLINTSTIKISSFFENALQKFPSIFDNNLKSFEECLSYLKNMSTPNKCLCGAAIEEIPAWNCLDCSKYEKTIICEDCYLRSKDLHKGHKIVYLSYAEGVCNCGDPESFNTYCHEHNGPFVEQKQIDEYIQKCFGKKLDENLKIFFDEFFYEFSKYLILTEKCELFIQDKYNDKFSGELNEQLSNEKNDINILMSNFRVVFQNLIYFLRLITKNNLAMIHLIAYYFSKNNLELKQIDKEYLTDHRCIEINQQNIKIYYNTTKKENHICKCPFYRLFMTNYRKKINLKSHEDEKEFMFSFVHNLPARYTFTILYFFLYKENLYNDNTKIKNLKTHFYMEDILELIIQKTSLLEESVDELYKYLLLMMKKFDNTDKKKLVNAVTKKLYFFYHLGHEINYFINPKTRLFLIEKTLLFQRFIDITCLIHNIYEYKSIVPHPIFQDQPPNQLLFTLEEELRIIVNILNCSLEWKKIEKLNKIYRYIIYKILNQEKEGIQQLKENEFSYFLILYRIFGLFINSFCFNNSFINNCSILDSIYFFKKTFFDSQKQIENFVDIILKDYFKFFGFICGTKNNFFNYYDNAIVYFGIYSDKFQTDFTLLKYLFVLSEKEIDINSYLKLSNIENVYSKFDQIFNLGIKFNNNEKKDKNDEKDVNRETELEIFINNIKKDENLTREEKRNLIMRVLINDEFNKSDATKDEYNIIIQWENLIQFLINIIRDDSSCYDSLIKIYNKTVSLKTKNELFNNIKNNKFVMKDLENILKEKMILNLISYKNLIDLQTLEKKMDEYFSFLFNENNIFNKTLDELTNNKIYGEKKMFGLKDDCLKFIDFNYYISPIARSSAQKYILDFKKDIVKTYNYYFYNNSELTFGFFHKVFEKVLLNKNNLELIKKIIDKLPNEDKVFENLDKKSFRNSFLPIILNYLQIFNVINTKSFIEFKMKNKIIINNIYELLYNFIKNNSTNNIIDKDLEEYIKEVLNHINRYQVIFNIYNGDLEKLNKYDYNTEILEVSQIDKTNLNNINIIQRNTNSIDEKKLKCKNMKDKLKNIMKTKSNNFMKKIESNEEMIKVFEQQTNDIDNNNDEFICFYCRNSINLNSFENPYGKLGLYIKDLFYTNSIIATLRDEFQILELKDDNNKIYEKIIQMINRQDYFRLISCGHYFHTSCFIEQCTKNNNVGINCPLCLKYQNILIPPLVLFHDKYSFLKSKKINELFKKEDNIEKINEKEINEGINLFNSNVMNFLISTELFKNEIKNYKKFIDDIYPYYKALFNYLENIFYLNCSTFHKQQQIDNIKNLILSLRLIINDSKDFDINEIFKFIKEIFLEISSCPKENEDIYQYNDSYMHYTNLLDKIILSMLILFDYEEFMETLKYIIYIILPYFTFGLYFKKLIIEKHNNNLTEEQFKEKMKLNEFNQYLKDDNNNIMKHLNLFLQKFYFIKLISDYQNKNEDIINNFNELSFPDLLSLINMSNLLTILPEKEISINDIINSLPKVFNSNDIFYILFSSNLNFNKVINSLIENVKNSIEFVNYEINPELIIQFSPIKFNFIHLDNNIFDLIERNIGKKCNVCGEKPEISFLCLICGEKICKRINFELKYDELISHVHNCTNGFCILFDMDRFKMIYIDENEKSIIFNMIYTNKAGNSPKGLEISHEFNLNHEKLKSVLKSYVSKDFHFG